MSGTDGLWNVAMPASVGIAEIEGTQGLHRLSHHRVGHHVACLP